MKNREEILSGIKPSLDELSQWLNTQDMTELLPLMALASDVRKATQGNGAELCAIVNAKSGRCSEDCAFCAQSIHHDAGIETYPLLSAEQIIERGKKASDDGVKRFSIVISGRDCPSGEQFRKICLAIDGLRTKAGVLPCASLGLLKREQATRLRECGLVRYHHNLESGPGFFSKICTSHELDDRIKTLGIAREAGLEICSGGIVGMGESMEQRAELALALAEIRPDSVALNFLNPIKGTPLQGRSLLAPIEALAAVAAFRLAVPRAWLRCCGGRTQVLGKLSPMMYLAGANAVMTGDYLTTQGASAQQDSADIRTMGLNLQGPNEVVS